MSPVHTDLLEIALVLFEKMLFLDVLRSTDWRAVKVSY